MQQITTLNELENIIEEFKGSKTFSNNFMLHEEMLVHINLNNLFFVKGKENAFFLLKKNGFTRLFYYLNNLLEPFRIKNVEPIVQELIYRGEKFYPQKEISYWKNNGFNTHLVRDCLFCKSDIAESRKEDIKISNEFQVKKIFLHENIQEAHGLIKKYLDPFTGDILSKKELMDFSTRDELIGVFVNNKLAGVLQAELKNGIYWLGHIVVNESYRGKSLSSVLLKQYFENGLKLGVRQFQLWVISDNTRALNLYKKYGFKYLNKSTISLLSNG